MDEEYFMENKLNKCCIMKNMKLVLALCILVLANSCISKDYKDSSLSPEERARILLSQMTLEEKAAQLYRAAEQTFIKDNEVSLDSLKKYVPDGTGIVYLKMYGDPKEYAQRANDYQRYLVENTRLGIPALFGGDRSPPCSCR